VPDTTLDRIRCPAVSKSVSEEPMRARRQRNLSRHQKFFCKNVFHRKVYPLYRDGTIFGQVFVRGGMTKIGKSPLPGGQARRNKLLVSRGPLVIAPPLAGLIARSFEMRCTVPVPIPLQDTDTLRKLLSHLALGCAVARITLKAKENL
jgi:hypothetical protein